jgi:ATP-dependent DNA helicase DinG
MFCDGDARRAREADLIIVNHHLFFADLALKQDDFGSILPEYSAVVFDEAHEIEDVASDYFGRQISNYRFEELAQGCRHGAAAAEAGDAVAAAEDAADSRAESGRFLMHFQPSDGRFPFSRNEREAFLEQNREAYTALMEALKGLETEFAAVTQKPEELTRLARRSFRAAARDDFPV